MRTILIFLIILAVAIIGFFVARDKGWIDGPSGDDTTIVTGQKKDRDADESDDGVRPPRFDIVRVNRSGYAVIAGVAEPKSTIELLANGEAIADTDVEGDGAWAINTDTPLNTGTIELTLKMTTADGLVIFSEETVVVYVPERAGDAPLILRTTPGGASEVLQRPTDPDVSLGPLALETIDYDSSGNVIFAGRATPGATVQILANMKFLGSTVASDRGRWQFDAQLAPGIYKLTIVQLNDLGKPEYAIELPFERAGYDDVRLEDGRVIVQPGNSLWVISRKAYGEGAQYTVIYEANKDQIRDPDLIYPGQVFSVPEEDGEDPDEAADEGEDTN